MMEKMEVMKPLRCRLSWSLQLWLPCYSNMSMRLPHNYCGAGIEGLDRNWETKGFFHAANMTFPSAS